MLRIGKFTLRVGWMRYFALLCFLGVVCGGVVLGQNFSPGSINTTNNALGYWLRPENANCSAPACQIDTLRSNVFPAQTGREAITPVSRPNSVRYRTSQFNFNPYVEITNSWFGFNRNLGGSPTGKITQDWTGFVVFRTAQSGTGPATNFWQDPAVIGGADNTMVQSDFSVTMFTDSIRYAHVNGANGYTNIKGRVTLNKPHILTVFRDRGNAAEVTSMRLDGTLIGQTTGLNDQTTPDSIFFGSNDDHDPGARFDGDYGDISFFAALVSGWRMEKIHTYLALKYGITLSHHYKRLRGTANTNIYCIDAVYNKGIFGVARNDSCFLDQRVSQSVDYTDLMMIYGTPAVAPGPGFAFPNPIQNSNFAAIPTDDSYQIIGHDGGTTGFTKTFAGVPNSQLDRTYKAYDYQAGTVTLFFPQSSFTGLSAPGPYYLVYGKDPKFGMGETYVPMSIRGGGSFDYYAQVNFPDNDSCFFTVVRGDVSFPAPGGVSKGLELWLNGEKGVTGTTNITAWTDQSFNSHNTTCTAGTAQLSSVASQKVNYHRYVEAKSVNVSWSTLDRFRGKVIMAVGQAKQAQVGVNEGWLGFEVTNPAVVRRGLRSDGGSKIMKNGANDWTNGAAGGALLRENGADIPAATSVLQNRWALIGGRRDTTAGAELNNGRFFVGGFVSGDELDSIKFAEILVYDQGMEGTGNRNMRRVESYLAIKYGLTLSVPYRTSNWDGVSVNNVYNPVSYGNDIAGIGRDSVGALFQHQGMTNEADSLVSIALNDHYSWDSLNPNPLPDGCFMMMGNNGDSVHCWSSTDIHIGGEQGVYQRIPREWKMQKTGPWNGEVVELRFRVDNPNANVPALLTGSPQYLLFTDPDGNFANGGTNVFPMTQISTGLYRVDMDESDFPSGSSFFTFGAKLDSTIWGTQSKCVGSSFKVWGSRLGEICTELMLENGGTSYFATQGGSVTDNTYQITTNRGGKCMDTLTWRIPTIAAAIDYDLRVDTVTTPFGCGTGTITSNVDNGRQVVDSILVDSSEIASVTWPGDSIYCVNEPNVLPDTSGSTVGVFSYFAGPLTGNPNAILPNPNTGELMIHSGSVGTHTIRYVTNGGFQCKDTADMIIKIRSLGSPTISYTGSPYCGGLDSTGMATITGTLRGSFRSSAGLVFYDTLTGNVNLPQTLPGTYTIFYHPHVDSCANVASTTIVVAQPERAYFNYVDSVYCFGASPANPIIQYMPATGIFIDSTGGGLVIDDTTGQINLTTSTPGTHVIAFTGISGVCTYSATDTIIIQTPPNAAFTLPNDTLCLSNANFIPTQVNTSGYFVNLNGMIDISPADSVTIRPSLSTAGGPYDLFHIVPAVNCPDTTVQQMWFRGVAAASIAFPDTVLCENEPNPLPVFNSGIGGGSFISQGPNFAIFVDSLTGEVDLLGTGVGTNYDVWYAVPDPSCPDTVLVATLDIDAVPNPAFSITPDSICQNSGNYGIDVPPPAGFNFSIYIGPNVVPGAFTADTLDVNALIPGGPYMVQNVQTTGACSDTAYDFITIVEQDTANIQFFPNIICIGGNNPFPLILGDGGGIFSLMPGAPYNVVVDPDSGIMYLVDTMPLGIYVLNYTTQGLCPSSDTSLVDIRNEQNATFNYTESKICQTDTVQLVPEPGFASGGLFTSTPPTLVFVNPATGVIDVNGSPADTFSIRYDLSSAGSCNSTFTDQLIIVKRDSNTTITYNGSPYCPSDPSPAPVMAGSFCNEGLFSSPGMYFANQDSGVISLAATPPDTYEVKFQKLTVCEEEFMDTIIIKPAADATVIYDEPIYCIGPNNPAPTFVANYGGVFGFVPDSVNQTLVIDVDSGEIDLFNSTAGNYLVTYTINPSGSSCGGTSSTQIRILPQPTNVDMFPTSAFGSSDSICDNMYVLFTATGADLITWHYDHVDSPSVGSGTYFDGIGLDSGRVVIAEFNTLQGCEDVRSVTMHVFPIPEASVLPVPPILAGNDEILIDVLLESNDTYIRWTVSGIGEIRFDSTSGQSIESDSGLVVPLGNTVYLDSEINPAQFTYSITPHTFLCQGVTESVTVSVNPNDQDIFVPQVMTPDGNAQNDTWFIQWKADIDPSLFTIQLFNSAGARVHTMNPIVNSFDGVGNEAGYLPDGVYWYILTDEAGAKVDAGGLTIRRK